VTGGEHEVWRARLAAQLLSGTPGRGVEEVVARLLAVQAQDARGARLAVRSRTAGVRAADVDDALTSQRSVVVTWLNRGTLHLVTADDYWWLHPLTTPQLATTIRRRLAQEGVGSAGADRGVAVVLDAVRSEGPLTRAQLRERLDDAGVPTAGQALVQVLAEASVHGDLIRGPVVGAEQAFVSAEQWLGRAPAPLDRDEGLARLARRYLVGHGPAADRDLARWAKLPLRDARRGLDAISDDLESVAGGRRLAGPSPAVAPPPWPAPRLLGPFDPLLLGWASREAIVGAHRAVVTTNGLFRPVALVEGRVVGWWGLASGVVTITLLEPVAARERAALVADASAVLAFLDLPDSPTVVRPAP